MSEFMAQFEADREALLAEARNLVERVELLVAGLDEPLVAGFRRGGAASFYFGAEAVFQFNSLLQWRRGFHAGRLLKAERGKIVELTRRRTEQRVELLRHDFDQPATTDYLEFVAQRMRALQAALQANRYRLVGQVPADGEVIARLGRWLDQLPVPIAVARRPNV